MLEGDMDAPISIFIVVAVVFVAMIALMWRYWKSVSEVTPSDEAMSRRIARLNDRQANRIDDDVLRSRQTSDDAWRIMVERGENTQRRPRYTTTRRAKERKQR
jgi:hypothetical protein